VEATGQALEAMQSALAKDLACGRTRPPAQFEDLRALASELAAEWPDAAPARAAVETALADLSAQRACLPLAVWLSAAARPAVPVNAVIGAVPPWEAASVAREAVARGYRTVKVKVGRQDVMDLQRLAAVRAAVGGRVALRADANGAWDPLRAEVMVDALAAHDLEYVEQPVPADDIAALARLRRCGAAPVAADEALLLPGGPERVLDSEAADVLVLKPGLLGGLSAAWDLAAKARGKGMAVVVTSALDSAIGRAAALHLAAALPALDLACGLATGHRLAVDVADGPRPHRGQLLVPATPGLGVSADAWAGPKA
jgi:L-alanine-DL-glutamate epimerase-like enolase superfamily enzyme